MFFKLIQPRLNYYLSLKAVKVAFLALIRKQSDSTVDLSEYFGENCIYFFNRGRTGLQFILKLFPEGSAVAVQPYTCPTVLKAIKDAGCKIVFIDITSQLTLDLESYKKQIDQIDIVIVTHTFGCPADVESFRSVSADKIIIEDCAHSFLSKKGNKYVGQSGDFSFFSHGYAKFPSSVQGGIVLVNNKSFSERFNSAYQDLFSPPFKMLILNFLKSIVLTLLHKRVLYSLFTYPAKKLKRKHDPLTDNEKKENIQKGLRTCMNILYSEIKDICRKLNKQQSNGKAILASLAGNPSFKVCQPSEGANFFMVPAIVNDPRHFIRYALKGGIEIGRHFAISGKIIPCFGYMPGNCPTYEKMTDHLITIPSYYNYPVKRFKQLIRLLEEYDNRI